MKKFYLIASVFLFLTLQTYAETKQALTLHMVSGTNIVYFLDTEPTIGFNNQNMILTVGDKSSEIPMQDISNWEIGYAEYTGSESAVSTDAIKVIVYGRQVKVYSNDSNDVGVFNSVGQCINSAFGKEVSFYLPAGLYVINVTNHSYKIVIR